MIKIVARMIIKEECIEAFHKAAAELIAKSRAEEGNVFYSLNQSTANPQLHCFIECWKDQEAISIHNATEHFTTIVPSFAAFMQEHLPTEFYNELEL